MSRVFSVVDLYANPTPLSAYALKAVSVEATLTGFYADIQGRQVSNLVTITVPTNGVAVFAQEAESFIGKLSADVYVGTSAKSDGTVTYTPVAGYPVAKAADYIVFGRAC